MSKEFEIFCRIYTALDRFNDLCGGSFPDLQVYLSEANPYIWKGEFSGDPAVYDEFLGIIKSIDIYNHDCYEIAEVYFAKIDDYYCDARKAFESLSKQEFDSLLTDSECANS